MRVGGFAPEPPPLRGAERAKAPSGRPGNEMKGSGPTVGEGARRESAERGGLGLIGVSPPVHIKYRELETV